MKGAELAELRVVQVRAPTDVRLVGRPERVVEEDPGVVPARRGDFPEGHAAAPDQLPVGQWVLRIWEPATESDDRDVQKALPPVWPPGSLAAFGASRQGREISVQDPRNVRQATSRCGGAATASPVDCAPHEGASDGWIRVRRFLRRRAAVGARPYGPRPGAPLLRLQVSENVTEYRIHGGCGRGPALTGCRGARGGRSRPRGRAGQGTAAPGGFPGQHGGDQKSDRRGRSPRAWGEEVRLCLLGVGERAERRRQRGPARRA